nr:Mediator complex domain containing protein [Haemonchus contortus]
MAMNGGSLEECFSNVYALTELNGLKWRCFLTPSNSPRGIPIQSDPVLKAYGKCLRDGLLCTWRRKPLQMSSQPEPLPLPSFTNEISKELWLFWYSNDPPEKLSINTSHLDADENGVGTAANGINYEVRVLLFQALHTMIERSMAHDGFVRFGRWFTRPLREPLPGRQHLLPRYIMATNVQFFVHGGNTVCMTVNAQRQPPLLRLSKRHLESGQRVQVVVGPWSLHAVLLPRGSEVGRNQPSAEKQWEEWREFVAPLVRDIDDTEEENQEEGIPRMVPVEIDGIRMLYPSCYVCVTMDDDAACSKDEPSVPAMTPDELIAPDNGRRNQLLVSNANGHSYMQGVLQNAYLAPSRPQPPVPPPQVGPFQAPFPPPSDDETRWNFVDLSKSDSCSCDNCTRQPSAEYLASLEREPVIDCPLAAPIKVAARPGMVKTNPLYTVMKRQSKRRTKHSYHRRFPLNSDPVEESNSPSESVASEQDSSDDDIGGVPAWADTNKQSLVTGIYCSADDASYHFGVATPCNSSDDENLACSPFTPIKVVSPCTNCAWPSAPADQIPESVFNQIFQPSSTSRVPSTASQEERQRDYNCYYNPTMREDPYYMSYHSRRTGEKRRSNYPPTIKLPASPEQPGSQETIPATTSPPPEMDEHRRRAPEADSSITMTRAVTDLDIKNRADVQVPVKKRTRRKERKVEWPDLDSLDMALLSTTIGEEMESRVSPYAGRITPTYESDSEPEVEEQSSSSDGDETRAIGEGPSGLTTSPGFSEVHIMRSSEEAMEVDEAAAGGPTDSMNLLSPPASNERPDGCATMSINYGAWPRIGGPPSCGEPSMNHIYPTPPSVQSEAQQFSPAPMLPPHQQHAMQHQHTNVVMMQHANVMDTSNYTPSGLQQSSTQQRVPPSQAAESKPGLKEVKEEVTEEQNDPEDDIIDLVPMDSKMGKLLKRIELLPVSGHLRKRIVPSSTRFSPAADVRVLCATLSSRRTTLHMPPDYQKLVRLMEKRVPKHSESLYTSQFPSCIPSVASSHTAPVTVTSFPNANNYKPTFGPIPGGMASNPPHMQMPPMQPPQSHHIQQFPASQIRTPPMMGGRMGTPVGTAPGPIGPPYAPSSGPYGAMMPPPNSVQQLNNFVHGPMFNGGNGQMNPHHPMGNMSMGQPMGPMYASGPGQMPMMPSCPTSGYGVPPMMGGYGPSAPNMMGPPHPNAPPAYPGAPGPPPAYNSMNQMQPMQPPHMRQMQMMQQMMPSQTPMPMMNSYGNNGPANGNMQFAPPPANREVIVPFAEGASVVLAIILQDTILDLHFDSVFDACPICSCNTSIRARELGLYITPPDVLRMPAHVQQAQIGSWSGFALEQANTCTCGFSAVRHRYLSLCSGLFPEDSREATAIEHSVAPVNGLGADVGLQASSQIWFDSTSSTDVNMLDLLRIMCQQHHMGRMVHQIAQFVEQADKAIKPQEVGFDVTSNAEYVLSQVDATELMLIGNSAAEMSRISGNRSRSTNQPILQFFHPWGLQVANEVRDPREAEWRGLLSEIGPVLERAMRIVRCMHSAPGNIVEGPLTWRALTSKSLPKSSAPTHDDDISLPEPIPYINVAAEKDAIRAAPHIVRHWEHLSLGPIDQPKDVLYLVVVPDNPDICNLAVKYLEQLSQMYERMRLGRHIAMPTGVDSRDGCVRVGCRTQTGKYPTETTTLDFLNLVGRYVDNKAFMTKLRLFTQQMEENVLQLLSERDDIFERATYRETLALDWRAKRAAAAAVALAVEQRMAENSAEQGASVAAPEQPPAEPPLEPEDIPVDEPGTLPHVIVIYVMNPFTWGTEFRSALFTRVATLAVMRAFNTVCLRLPANRRPQLQLEIIPMEQVTDLLGCLPDYTNDNGSSQSMFENSGGSEREQVECVAVESLRNTVLSVYTQPRVLTADCIKSVQARCMTKFGPGSSLLDSLDEWERSGTTVFYKVPSNAYHLAPPPLLYQKHENGRIIQSSPEEQVLYVTYCVIGSDWLCVAVTDSLGRLNDNCLINLRTRHDHHIYKYRQQTQILDAMGRLWTYILGVLSMETRNWRLVIGRLGRIGHGEFKAWTYLLNKTALKRHSARLREVCTACAQMPGCTGTPSILSACLVSTEPEPYLRMFPGFSLNDAYSKKTRSTLPDDTNVTHIMVFPTSADIQLGSADQHAVGEDDWDFSDMDIPQDGNDLGDDFLSSICMDNLGPPQPSASFRNAGNSFFSENTADVSMENQPLPTGFYISTAPAADVPDWFWAIYSGAKNRTPVHLKSSLHINVPLVHQGDEFLQGKATTGDKQEKESAHPLDSTRTDEVLRHVLETYNALSWLNIDVVSGERRSCLPIHMQALTRLYHSVARLIM